MEAFNLEAAMKGAAIFTRDGRKVKILTYTMKNERPILAIIKQPNGREFSLEYFADGTLCKRKSLKNKGHEDVVFTETRDEDLMIEPNRYRAMVISARSSPTFKIRRIIVKKPCSAMKELISFAKMKFTQLK